MDYLKTKELYHALNDWGKRRKNSLRDPEFVNFKVTDAPQHGTSTHVGRQKTYSNSESSQTASFANAIEYSRFASTVLGTPKNKHSRNEWVSLSSQCATRINEVTAFRDARKNIDTASLNDLIVKLRTAKAHCDEMAKSYANDVNAKTNADMEKARAKVAKLNKAGEANVKKKLAVEKKQKRADAIRNFFWHSAMNSNNYLAVRELYHSGHKYTRKWYDNGYWHYEYGFNKKGFNPINTIQDKLGIDEKKTYERQKANSDAQRDHRDYVKSYLTNPDYQQENVQEFVKNELKGQNQALRKEDAYTNIAFKKYKATPMYKIDKATDKAKSFVEKTKKKLKYK